MGRLPNSADWEGQRARLLRLATPAFASDYIHHFREIIRPGTMLVLYCRVSGCEHNRDESLMRQIRHLRKAVARLGGYVIRVFPEVQAGYSWNRVWLSTAADFARRHGAILVAHSTDRFLRSADFHRYENPGARPNLGDFEHLQRAVGDVQLATFLPPDMPWQQVRSRETKRGLRLKPGVKCGRPPKPTTTACDLAQLWEIMCDYGFSISTRQVMRTCRSFRHSAPAVCAAARKFGLVRKKLTSKTKPRIVWTMPGDISSILGQGETGVNP